MRLKPLNRAMALLFSVTIIGASDIAIASGLDSTSASLTGSVSLDGSTQSAPGPTFDLGTTQQFYICLCAPYNSNAIGELSEGVISVQAVTSANQSGTGSAISTYTTTITNTSAINQSGSFNFYIGSATLMASPLTNYGVGADSAEATIDASIAVNGQTAWSYSATLTGTSSSSFQPSVFNTTTFGTGPSFTSSLFQDNFIGIDTFSPYSGTVALGTLAPGASEQLTYTLSGDTFNSLPESDLNFYGGSLAQIGDPFSVQSQGLSTFSVGPPSVVAAVPEPGTEVMMAAGIALLGGLALRRKGRLAEGRASPAAL